MSQWTFVIAAYLIVLVATTGLLLLSWRAMRRAETAAEIVRRP